MSSLKLESGWSNILSTEIEKPYMQKIRSFLKNEMASGRVFFPSPKLIFNALDLCPWDMVKVVIIGQDPYHSTEIIEGETVPHAHGLSFSIPRKNKKIPPSLQNIYKELTTDLGVGNFKPPNHGNLESWAKQGVLMLNATLTVQAYQANSHSKIGWQNFTNHIITSLSKHKENLVFILWGKFAQSKMELIDSSKHLVLKSAHPSPFSVHSGFFGSKPFSKTNEYLKEKGIKKIEWGKFD